MGRRYHSKGPTGGTGGFGRSHSTKPKPVTLEERIDAMPKTEVARKIGDLESRGAAGELRKSILSYPQQIKLTDLGPVQQEYVLLMARRHNERPEETLKKIHRSILLQTKNWKTFGSLPPDHKAGSDFITRAFTAYLKEYSYRHPKLRIGALLDRFVSQNPDAELVALAQAVKTNPPQAWNLFQDMFYSAFGRQFPSDLVP